MNDAAPKRTVSVDALEDWMQRIMVAAGASTEQASLAAECLADAHRRGLDTHGALILRLYLPRLASGAIAGRSRAEVISDLPGALVIDGRNGLGPYVAALATDWACQKAQAAGAAVVAVRNSNHFGAAAVYASRAAARDCAMVLFSNSDPGLAPEGTAGPVLGTNPIAIAGPASPRSEVAPCLDMAASTVALGKVRAADRAGERLPEGWAIDAAGVPTDDPQAALAGSMLPLGGHKGFGLAAMVDLLSGCVPGANVSPDITGDPDSIEPQGTGHLLVAIAIDQIPGRTAYEQRLDRLAEAIHEAPRAAGAERLMLPGEPERRVERVRLGEVPFDEASYGMLVALGDRFAVPAPEAT